MSPEGQEILTYLKTERRFSDEVIDRFNIGYCPHRVNHELRGRIITPIYTPYGELVALSSRCRDKSISNRFWHESFDKGTHLYALNFAKKAIEEVNKVIVVEGEFDVGAYHSAGLNMVVGTLGSSFTLFQVSLLLRYCSEIYLMFDGDEAGRSAIKRSMSMYEEYNLKEFGVKFIPVNLPNKIDPDDFLFKEGRHGVIEKLRKSKEELMFI